MKVKPKITTEYFSSKRSCQINVCLSEQKALGVRRLLAQGKTNVQIKTEKGREKLDCLVVLWIQGQSS